MLNTSNEDPAQQNAVKVQIWTVRELVDSLEGIGEKRIFVPSFQRSYVWPPKRKEELIESIRRSLPIGSLLMYYAGIRDDKPTYEIVDGLQRSMSLKKYEREVFEFFGKDDVDSEFIDNIVGLLGENDVHAEYAELELRRGKVANAVRRWVRKRTSFSGRDGFLVTGLLEELAKSLSSPSLQMNRPAIDVCQDYLEQLKDELDISDYEIPVIVVSGSRSVLPDVFERLNTKGMRLNKFDILASSWSGKAVIVENKDVRHHLDMRKKALQAVEIEREGFQLEDKSFELFHAACAIGAYLVERYPRLFKKAAKGGAGIPEAAGFNVMALSFGLKLDAMGDIPDRLKEFGSLDRYFEVVTRAADSVWGYLSPLLQIDIAGGENNSTHTELQIASIVATLFRGMVGLEPQRLCAPKVRRERILQHYLTDALRREWTGTGDAKAYRAVTTDRYAEEVSARTFRAQAESWYLEMLENPNGKRGGKLDSSLATFLRAVAVAQLGVTEPQSMKLEPKPVLGNLQLINISPNVVANLRLVDAHGMTAADPGAALPPLPPEPSQQQLRQRLDQRFNAMVDVVAAHFDFAS